jgi:hypothetical protein
MAKNAGEYPWSRHVSCINREKGKKLVDTGQVLRMFSDDHSKGRKLYRVFMGDGVALKKEDVYGTVDQRIVGDERFAEEVRERHEVELGSIRTMKAHKLEEIAGKIEDFTGVGLDEMRRKGKGRKKTMARKLCALAAREYGYKGTEISLFLQKDPGVITRYLAARSELAGEIGQVLALLNDLNSNRQA